MEVKYVSFELGKDHWSGSSGESVWAVQLSNSTYQLQNLLFFVDNISYEDVFTVKKVDGILCFDKVFSRSGNSTYRLFRSPEVHQDIFAEYLNPLMKHGCGFEYSRLIYAINIPAVSDIIEIHKLFELGAQAGIWEFEVSHCGHFI